MSVRAPFALSSQSEAIDGDKRGQEIYCQKRIIFPFLWTKEDGGVSDSDIPSYTQSQHNTKTKGTH